MPSFLARPALAALRTGALGALAIVAAQRPATLAAQALSPAPYVAPAAGTRYVYRDYVNVVTRSDGWRTYFTDQRGRPGLHTGVFIPDDPTAPLSLDVSDIARLWPLRVGSSTKVPTSRGPLQWRWELSVIDTATIRVPAGRFATYVVQAIEVPVVAATPQPSVNYTTFWYAPSVGAVVRFKAGQLVSPRRNLPVRQELVRIERPASGG